MARVTKYYSAAGQRIAVRVGGTLYFLHADHLGSTSEVSGATGSLVGRERYYPYGQVRYVWGSLPTTYNDTGQRLDGSTGLLYYGARYYDPYLSRWIQPDTIVPNPGNPQSLNRYSYALGNPVKYIDPTGHRACEDVDSCLPPDVAPYVGYNPYGIIFTAEAGTTWVEHDILEALNAAEAIAHGLWATANVENLLAYKLGEAPRQRVSPAQIFQQVMGTVEFHRSANSCAPFQCWARTAATATGNRVTVYTSDNINLGIQNGSYTRQNAAHELGHAFDNRTGRQARADLNNANITYVDPITGLIVPLPTGAGRVDAGFATANGARPSTWQQNPAPTAGEEFADMFLGWAYNHFANNAAGAARYAWMVTNMSEWIGLASR